MNSRARLGGALLLGFTLVAVLGPHVVALDPMPNYELRFAPMSLAHPLGTDYAGRDLLRELVHGTDDILAIALCTGVFAVLLACLVGIAAALSGSALLTGAIDVFLTVPPFPVMAIASALFRIDNPLTFGALLALFSWPGLARSLRAQVLALQQKEFVEVARLMRMGQAHILFVEILPNLVPYLTLNFILIARNAITASVGIMMLGLVPLRVENWGMMLNLAAFQSGALFLPQGRLYLLAPLCAIVLFQYALMLFASGLEEHFDPRLRRQS